ncbi:endothelin-converting enzyme [Aphelenchoides avenae]|nr:endothelin-converting enzyme [Aphelenchus avenae]
MPLFLQLLLVFTPEIVFSVAEGVDTESAEHLLSSIEDFNDPCTDFYEFTCADWIGQHPIPANEESTSVLDIDRWSVRRQLRG